MRPARVQLLVTCLVDRFFPGTGESVVRVLERAGVAVTVPTGQTCCGQPAFNAGYDPDARALARHTIDVLSASDDPVVIPSGSCGDMVSTRTWRCSATIRIRARMRGRWRADLRADDVS